MAKEREFGIANLKEAVTFAINMTESIQTRFSDGGFSLWDGLSLIPQASNVRRYVNNGDKIKREFFDLDSGERKELIDYVKEELDLTDDYVENIVGESLNLLEALSGLIVAINKDRTS